MPKELDTACAGLVVLMSNAIWRSDEDAVRNGVRTLNGTPRFNLSSSKIVLLGGGPAVSRGIKQDIRPEETRNARCFGIPLNPANDHPDVHMPRAPHTKPAPLICDFADGIDPVIVCGVAGDEEVHLVEEEIVGNVHLAIHA